MSTDVKLVGIREIALKGAAFPVPGVVAEIGELGFSGLYRDLQHYAEAHSDVLVPAKENELEPGLDQILIADPHSFLADVRGDPHYWDSVGFGWEPALAALEKDLSEGHSLVWWLVVDW